MTNEISPYVSPQFIKVYENVIPHSFCDELIQKFESNSDKWENRNQLSSERHLSFKEMHCGKHMDIWKEECEILSNVFMKYVNEYKLDFSSFVFQIDLE